MPGRLVTASFPIHPSYNELGTLEGNELQKQTGRENMRTFYSELEPLSIKSLRTVRWCFCFSLNLLILNVKILKA